MGTIANAKVTHYYNCYNGDFIGCLPYSDGRVAAIVVSVLYRMFTSSISFIAVITSRVHSK